MHFPLRFSPLLIALLIVLCGAVAAGAIVTYAQENPLENITFPIAELGNCENEDSCKAYCDDLSHMRECVAFAEQNGLMSARDARSARALADAGTIGPGGCNSHDSCHAYCENVENINECLAFAQERDVYDDEELEEVRAIREALEEGAALPGGCTNKGECAAYCEKPEHVNECLAFAEDAGFMEPDEVEDARRMAEFLAAGDTPGECRTEKECENYCSKDEHIQECVLFAEELGLISPQEAEVIRKTNGEGPGGCKGAACATFCEKEENQEACFVFALENGLIPEAELREMEEGIAPLRKDVAEAPEEVKRCLQKSLGADILQRIQSPTFFPDQKTVDAIDSCIITFLPDESDSILFEPTPPEFEHCIEKFHGPDIAKDPEKHHLVDWEKVDGCVAEFYTGMDQQEHPVFDDEKVFLDEFDDGKKFEEQYFVPDFPPEIFACGRDIFGPDFEKQLARGELRIDVFDKNVEECMERKFADTFKEEFTQPEFPLKEEEKHDFARQFDDGKFEQQFDTSFEKSEFENFDGPPPFDESKPFPDDFSAYPPPGEMYPPFEDLKEEEKRFFEENKPVGFDNPYLANVLSILLRLLPF